MKLNELASLPSAVFCGTRTRKQTAQERDAQGILKPTRLLVPFVCLHFTRDILGHYTCYTALL